MNDVCATCGNDPDEPDAYPRENTNAIFCYGDCDKYRVPRAGTELHAELDDYLIYHLDPDGHLTRDEIEFMEIVQLLEGTK